MSAAKGELHSSVVTGSGEGSIGRRPARYDRRRPTAPTVSVIIPTYNERENIPILLERLAEILADFDYEIVVVDDDSPDRTWQVADDIGARNHRIRVLRRVGSRGLSSAVIDGMASARGSVLAVMDADLQHDETVLPDIIAAVLDDEADICLGSREAPGGSYGQFGPIRRLVSWSGAQLARCLLGVTVSDPMSGYFAVSREHFDSVRGTINPQGFKILLELLARGTRPRVAEIGYRFRIRTWGQTKLNPSVALAYLWSLLNLALARAVPSAFAAYVAIAVTGLSLRLSLTSVFSLMGWSAPGFGPLLATELAILFEFAGHSSFTFARRRPLGRGRISALFRFHLVSLHAVLALTGLTTVVESRLSASGAIVELLTALGLSAVGIVATITLSFVLNSSLTWPHPGTDGAKQAAAPAMARAASR